MWCKSVHTFLVIVVTDRQTNTQTNAGKNILPRFRGENDNFIRKLLNVQLAIKKGYCLSTTPALFLLLVNLHCDLLTQNKWVVRTHRHRETFLCQVW